MERIHVLCGKKKNRTSEEAFRLGISQDKLINLASVGTIPGTKLGVRTWIFDPDEVDAALIKLRKKGAE